MPDTIFLDWSFWAVVVSVIAIVLSQLPPVLSWFKKAKLDLEVYSKISISHKVGNPNLEAHLIIRNIGGRITRIKEINVTLTRDGKKLITLPAQNYLQKQTDQNGLLFTTFSLAPNEEWAHITNFLNFFDRSEEITIQGIDGEMRADLDAKIQGSETDPDKLIEHDKDVTDKTIEFFNSKLTQPL